MPKLSNRDRILEAGLKVMFRKGYVGAGVRDIVAEAPAPQGSFTNHFRSKEEFAREVLDLYFEELKRLVAETLGDATARRAGA
jgi:TetR/AcrR family transcriptional regulator, transcriptional repressor for nem operon